jgi:hypothetical protein
MKTGKVVLSVVILLAGAAFSLYASGQAEKDPVFDPALPGWQGVTVRKGFDHLKKVNDRFYHAYIKSVSGLNKERLATLTGDFIAPALELYASAGTGFTLQRDTGHGWKATVAVLKAKSEQSLLRAMIYKAEDYGDNRLFTYKVKSYDKPFPLWEGSGQTRYVFSGVWNMTPLELPANGAFDYVIMRALERMAGELGPGEGPPLISGRLYLVEYRFLYISRERLGLYCRLAVEGD